MEDLIGRLKAANAQIERRDSLLAEDMVERRAAAASNPELAGRTPEGTQLGSGPTIEGGDKLSIDPNSRRRP